MQSPDITDHPIRERILRAIALNRTPGYHFCGNFFGASYEHVAGDDTHLVLDVGEHCSGNDGQIDIGALALFADVALATCVRAQMDHATRLATVSMNLQFTDAARTGRLDAHSSAQGLLTKTAGRQALCRIAIKSGENLLCFGGGAFMIMPAPKGVTLHPHPMPDRERYAQIKPIASAEELDADELWILRRAEASLAKSVAEGTNFIADFLGYEPRAHAGGASCVLKNGPHIANRVGHVQGGIILGLAATSAAAALGPSWVLTGISACYVRPGEGEMLEAGSEIAHHGRMTAVVRTLVANSSGGRVLEVLSTHASTAH
jgi:acyl-coenzyme A thioesterase PaaI-like protein